MFQSQPASTPATSHVAGYDIVSEEGYEKTMRKLDSTIGLKNVPVWHCNDAKAACADPSSIAISISGRELSDWSRSVAC